MDVKKLNHLGVAVPSIESVKGFYQDVLGLEPGGVEELADQKVKVAFFELGETRIELIEPTAEDSPVKKFLDSKGGKPAIHHVAYEVACLETALQEARAKGIRLVDETPRIGAHRMRIAFLHPQATCGVLTELCEPCSDNGRRS